MAHEPRETHALTSRLRLVSRRYYSHLKFPAGARGNFRKPTV